MKSTVNALFVDVKNEKAFYIQTDNRHVSLKNKVTRSSLERIATLTYNPRMATHFVEPQWIAIHRR